MKKQMFLFGLIMLVITIFAALAQTECIDCCNGGPCYGNSANSAALNIEECLVRINDRILKNDVTTLKAFERGQNLDIKVEFASLQNAEDVQVMAFITGYHRGSKFRDQIFDITSTFDVKANVSYEKTLRLRLPDDFKVETGDQLKIRIEISDKYSHSFIREYNLKVEAPDHNLVIQDIVLDPSDNVQAGRGLFANVRVRNMGDNTEESIKIIISIPELNIKATEYIDEIEANEALSSEDIFLRIPSCATPGNYIVKATLQYADGDEETAKQTTIKVTEDSTCEISPITQQEKTVITMPGKQDAMKGNPVVYPILISNNGVTDKAYQLSANGLESWSTYRFEPSTLVLVKAGKTETAYLYVTPKDDATTGEKVFMVTVETSGDKKQIALTANVLESQTQKPSTEFDLGDLRQGLIIGLIVLVVLLVILGLVVGFGKMKGNGKEPEEVTGQTYY